MPPSTTTWRGAARRLLGTAAVGALVLALAPAAAAQEGPTAPAIGNDTVCPPPRTETPDAFTDDEDSIHEENIDCAAAYDFVNGETETSYHPADDVTRAQMATIVVNELEAARGEPLPEGDDAFTDDEQSPHQKNINKLAAAGIVSGVGDNEYAPTRSVNRGQMATFIAEAIDYHDDADAANDSVLPTDVDDFFTDDEQSPHQNNINKLAAQGVVRGVAADMYAPIRDMTRAQIATAIMHTAEIAARLGLFAPVEIESRSLTADLATLNDSGVTGTATVTVNDDNSVTVTVEAEGVEAGEVHPQHIHGFADAGTNAVCPDATSADQTAGLPEEADDPDQYVALEEGADEYGPVQLPLANEDGSFPTPAGTTYTYERTFAPLDLGSLPPLDELENRAIVLHGMTVDSGEYIATLPVACGQLELGSLTAQLASLNDSGASGNATLTRNEDGTLTVQVTMTGVESGQVHPQHIHGFENEEFNSICPTADSADQDDGLPEEANDPDQYIALEEGADEYGGVLLPLDDDNDAFPSPAVPAYTYEHTFSESEVAALGDLDELENRAIVIHGMTVDSGEYVATLPIACGRISTSG